MFLYYVFAIHALTPTYTATHTKHDMLVMEEFENVEERYIWYMYM